jgi:hypothetical protein
MAKKIVRGITDIKTINNQDFDTNNVNDLLSDGQYNYIHRKKGKDEEYHNLTDNIKTISSDNTDLLAVTNNNKTTNTATLHPKHDAQKEQVLESTRNTISIHHGTNGTAEKTTVDTNPEKVLEHSNLQTTYGISKATAGNTTTLGLEYKRIETPFDLNNLVNGCVRSNLFIHAPNTNNWWFVKSFSEGTFAIQTATTFDDTNTTYVRQKKNNVWSGWREQVGDKSIIDGLLNTKQNTLQNNMSIGVVGNGLCQLYALKQTYSHDNGVLKTHVKIVSQNTSISTNEEEFNFTLKINQGSQVATFTLNTHDKIKFTNIITAYGVENAVRINGCLFTLSDSTLTVSTEANTESNYVISFSDII